MFFGWLIGLILLAYCIRLALLINLNQPNCCENNIQGHVSINKPVCFNLFLDAHGRKFIMFYYIFFYLCNINIKFGFKPNQINSTQPNPVI